MSLDSLSPRAQGRQSGCAAASQERQQREAQVSKRWVCLPGGGCQGRMMGDRLSPPGGASGLLLVALACTEKVGTGPAAGCATTGRKGWCSTLLWLH